MVARVDGSSPVLREMQQTKENSKVKKIRNGPSGAVYKDPLTRGKTELKR